MSPTIARSAQPRSGRRAQARAAPGGPLRRHPRPARPDRRRHGGGAQRLALARLRDRRPQPRDDAPIRRPDLRRGRRRRPRDHRQGRPPRAGRPRRVRAPRPRLRGLPDGRRRAQGRREPRRERPSPRHDADSDQVPAHHRAPLRGTGRQVEIIEVKGSVELAPLVGLADGIVDLVDTGRTLAENELEVREEIAACTARLIANRVVPQAACGRDRRHRRPTARGGDRMRIERIDWDGDNPGALAARLRGVVPGLADAAEDVREIVTAVRERGDAALAELAERFGETAPASTARRSARGRRGCGRARCRGRRGAPDRRHQHRSRGPRRARPARRPHHRGARAGPAGRDRHRTGRARPASTPPADAARIRPPF